ncbi:hypothetical protein [Shigella flexneri]|uniref:hypothetical protein n=1 Tax=Shigella flexneri TaxID=623 RepID=UPI00374D3B46
MTNINTACVKNNASYQLNNALPNKETISCDFCERLAQWGNKSLNNGEERAIAVERIKEAYNSNMASLDLSYLDLSELPPIPSTVNTLNLENNCLTYLDFTDNASLVNINLSFNKIKTITFPNESKLENIYIDHNNLENLDLKKQHSLVNLEAQNNNLTKNNISDSYKLKFLNLDYNKLASLDLSRQESLIELSAHHNMITDLILHNHPIVEKITLNDNHIAHLNAKKFGGVRVTLINFIFMAIFSALLFLTLPGTGSGNFIAFYAVFMGLFLTAGLGSGSTFQMIAVIFRQITIYRVKMKGGSDEQAQREAVTETAAALGFISAIGAVGGFFIPQAFGMSLNMTSSPVGAMKVFLIFYIVCVLLTWLVYGRRKFSQK